MMLTWFREIVQLFKSSGGGKKNAGGKVCPNGHVMHPTWDVCPYCQEALARAGGGGGKKAGGGGGAMPPPDMGAMPSGGATMMMSVGDIGSASKGGRPSGLGKAGKCVGWIVAINGQHSGEDFRLTSGKNTIGTASDADIVLTDKKLSRKHAVIRYEGGEFVVSDLDSSNGTYVNDEKVQKHDLIDNDIIKLGDVEFEFKCVSQHTRDKAG
jgi:hypothetical protein